MNRNFVVKTQVTPSPSEVYFSCAWGIVHATPSRRSVRNFVKFSTQTQLIFWLGHRQPNNQLMMVIVCKIKVRKSGFWNKFLFVEHRNLGNFCLWYPNPVLRNPKYSSRNPGSHKRLECGIQIPLLKIWNLVPRIRNPWRRLYGGDIFKSLYYSWDLRKFQRLNFHMGSIISGSLTKRCLLSMLNRPKCHQTGSYLEFADNCCIFLWLYLAAV